MGNHQRCWLWGRHVVTETLAAAYWPIVELRLSEQLDRDEQDTIVTRATDQGISVAFDTPSRLSQLCGATDHQGHLAKMSPFPYRGVDELLSLDPTPTALVLLDAIQDPHNFGAIIRSAEVLGMQGVVVGRSRQSDVTAIVARSSSGAVNHLPLAETGDLAKTARALRDEHGFTLVAADQHAEETAADHDWTVPTVLVIGNEAVGVSDAIRESCAAVVRIPQRGRTESLNAAAAASILFYELHCQRNA